MKSEKGNRNSIEESPFQKSKCWEIAKEVRKGERCIGGICAFGNGCSDP
jgi:hypothetical protein